jgi:hypothetical protein
MEDRDLDEMVAAAAEMLHAVRKIEAGVGGEIERRIITSRITQLDLERGQPFGVNFRGLQFYANSSEALGRRRPKDEPELAGGVVPSLAVLAAQARWVLTKFVNITSGGHFGVVLAAGTMSVAPADARGSAMLQIAKLLIQEQPGKLLMRRSQPCGYCGRDFTYQRSTRRFCSDACRRSAMRARQRAHEGETR